MSLKDERVSDSVRSDTTAPSRAAGLVKGLRRAQGLSGDRIFGLLILLLALSVLAIAGLIVFVLFQQSQRTFQEYGPLTFLAGSTWNPARDEYGALPFLVSTLITSFGAIVLAAPFAVGAAVFIAEYAPRWLAEPVSYLVELLAAIPSVVYGFWGVVVMVPFLRQLELLILQSPLRTIPFFSGPPAGYGVLAAICILAIMIVPYTAAVSRDVIRLVPKDQREAAYALGATKWEVIRYAVLPYARAGIFGGIVLSLGRALGETIAVTMVIGNATRIPRTLFDTAATMPSIIASQFPEALDALQRSSLIALGLYLFIATLLVNLLARYIIYRLSPKGLRL